MIPGKPMHFYYMLDENGNAHGVDDAQEWGKWFRNADRSLERTRIGDFEVSTSFIGMEHGISSEGDPILWETMIFGRLELLGVTDYQERYSSREDALRGHKEAVELVKSKIGNL